MLLDGSVARRTTCSSLVAAAAVALYSWLFAIFCADVAGPNRESRLRSYVGAKVPEAHGREAVGRRGKVSRFCAATGGLPRCSKCALRYSGSQWKPSAGLRPNLLPESKQRDSVSTGWQSCTSPSDTLTFEAHELGYGSPRTLVDRERRQMNAQDRLRKVSDFALNACTCRSVGEAEPTGLESTRIVLVPHREHPGEHVAFRH